MTLDLIMKVLKFGTFSTRYKDIYDMYYQCGKLNPDKLKICVSIYILDDPGMRENDQEAIVKRVKKTFSDEGFKQRVDSSDKRWLDNDIDEVFDGILSFLQNTDLI